MEFQNYEQMVNHYLDTDSSEVFGNMSPEHAQFIISKFIRSAKRSIAILSGCFCHDFYSGNNISEVIREKAKELPEGSIRIITADGEICDDIFKLKESVNAEYGKNIIEYRPGKFNGSTPLKHFLVVDGKRYRLEESHPVIKEGKAPEFVKAEVCCNGEIKSSVLLDVFNKIWGLLQPSQEMSMHAN